MKWSGGFFFFLLERTLFYKVPGLPKESLLQLLYAHIVMPYASVILLNAKIAVVTSL